MNARSHPALEILAGRILRERQRRGWTIRDLAGKTALSTATVNRAERALGDVWLSCALKIADALELSLQDMLTAPECPVCRDEPPAGFICATCGRGPEVAS